MEPLQTWWTTELYPTSDEDNFGVVGNFEVVKAADAQATIAALQARVRELEQWVQDQSTANLEKMQHMDEMQSRALEAESQLAQRTTELEAAKQHREQSENAAQLYYRELTRAKNRICEAAGLPPDSGYEPAIKHLQAELERVRGELVETSLYLQQERANRDSLAACVDRDVKTIKELREQNRVLREALQEIASDIKGNPKRKQMLADDDFWAAPGEHTLRQWIAKATLTATSQEGQG